jgi:signal transduction histidine kinase
MHASPRGAMTDAPVGRSVPAVTRRTRDLAIDLGICAAIVAYGLPPMLDASVNDPRATTIGPLLLPALLVAVLLRRSHPLGAACVFAVGCVVSGIPTFHQFRLVIAIPVAVAILFPLSRAPRSRALAGLAALLAGLMFVGATESVIHGMPGAASMAAFVVPLSLAVWGAGRIVAARERAAAELARRSERLRRQREATAELAVEIDRERLASDLDLAVRTRLQEMVELASPDELDAAAARSRFSRIESLGRESLDRMRTLLGLLRSTDRGAREPRPTLEQLDALLAAARDAGRAVDFEFEGERRPLGAGIELAAYRTLQHALAVVGSDPDPGTRIRVRYLPDRLELEVHGARAGGGAASAALMAARERVLSLGGTFSADTPSDGLQVLRARLPAVPAHA